VLCVAVAVFAGVVAGRLGRAPHAAFTDYSLRADSSTSLPRNWELRASNDGVQFVTLRVHTNEPTIQTGGDIASWRIATTSSGAEDKPYRFFRVVATSPASDGAKVLAVSGIEFYGILFTRDTR
jgi:hypothetical protein